MPRIYQRPSGHARTRRGGTGGRIVVALNKADRLEEADWEDRLTAAQAQGWEAVLVSAVKGSGPSDLPRASARAIQ